MAGNDLVLSTQEVKTFIDLWESHPNLWNPADRDYKSRQARHQTYREIAESMGNGWSEDQVKRKIESLRAHYRFCRNKKVKTTWAHYKKIRSFLAFSETANSADDSVNHVSVQNEGSPSYEEADNSEIDSILVVMDYAAEGEEDEDNSYDNVPETGADPNHDSSPAEQTDHQAFKVKAEAQEMTSTQMGEALGVTYSLEQTAPPGVASDDSTLSQLAGGGGYSVSSGPHPVSITPVLSSVAQPQSSPVRQTVCRLSSAGQFPQGPTSSVVHPHPRPVLPAGKIPSMLPAGKITGVLPAGKIPGPSSSLSQSVHSRPRPVHCVRNQRLEALKRKRLGDDDGLRKRVRGTRDTPLVVTLGEPVAVQGTAGATTNAAYAYGEKGGHPYRNYGLSVGDRLNELGNRKVIAEVMHVIETALYEAAISVLDDHL